MGQSARFGPSSCVRLATRLAEFLTGRPREVHAARVLARRRAAGRGRVDVNHVVASTAEMLPFLLGDGIRLALRLSDERVIVLGDVMDLEHVLLAVALHARDDMPDGGVLIIETAVVSDPPDAVVMEGVRPDGRVQLTISDTGRGLEPDVMAGASFGTDQEPHAGVGLTPAAATVRRLGGTLRIDREPFVGTTVTIDLPLAPTRRRPGAPAADSREALALR